MDSFISLMLDTLIVAFGLLLALSLVPVGGGGIFNDFNINDGYLALTALGYFIGSGIGFCVVVITRRTYAKR